MRILYFSRDYSTHDHRFLAALANTEHTVGYLQLERRGHVLEDRALPPEIKQIHWAGGRESAALKDGLRLVMSLRKVIREFKPDLILAGPIQRCAFLTALAGFEPLVSMSWGYDLLHDVHLGKSWAWATRFTLKRSSALVGDCDTIRNLAVEYEMAPDRIVTFPWGANITKYSPATDAELPELRKRLGWDESTFVLLSVRSWAPIYGVDGLAKAFVKAAQLHPELRLFMLGNGPLAPTVRRIFQHGGVLDRVQFPGQVSQEKLPDYYRAADLYISTSHSDGTSISLLEALASGCPVLLSDIPGNKEWITAAGKAGWLFKDGDVDALTEGILEVVAQRDRLPEIRQAARALAELRGDWQNNFPELFRAFELALAS